MGKKLSLQLLRAACKLEDLGCDRTDQLEPREGIIGQERAVKALNFGLGIKADGFNIYVAGAQGTGRTTAVKGFLEKLAQGQPVPHDWCYVNNFKNQYEPKALKLPAGLGVQLAQDMKQFINAARREIPRAFESEEYTKRREETLEHFGVYRKELINRINKRAQEEGMLIQTTQIGILIIPVRDGKPMGEQEILGLSEEEREHIENKRQQLEKELNATLKEIKAIDKRAAEAFEKLDREVATFVLGHLFGDLLQKYDGYEDVVSHLHQVRTDILENIDQFRREEGTGTGEKDLAKASSQWAQEMSFRKYEVNVVVDNSKLSGSPVVIELNPTHHNLFGRMEKEAHFGALVTDFTMIRGGSLHRANGGYLVLPLEEVAKAMFSWDSLKRALKNGEISLEEPGERLGMLASKSLRPEPIPLNVKVILIGDGVLYRLLYFYDQDFRELFKVKAEFDTTMERTRENIHRYVGFICTLCRKENLLHLDSGALGRVIEHSSRLAENQAKLSTRFAEIADVVREANYYAVSEESTYIEAEHVKMAIRERVERATLIAEKIREMIREGQILISTTGKAVGQVNGLAVLSLGDVSFGRPSRITASTGPGREGIIDIEREAKLGGPIHTKGVMILSGYLGAKYGREFPISLTARLVFEQNYEGVDGDSASSAELYALLSSLSGVPIKQGIAVTGSVNQQGQVQAIGGVNEKIEGFFAVCLEKGLTGEQGVVIPSSNVKNLMLKEEVIEAVEAGKFHVWAVDNIAQGIEILTGLPAGEPDADGYYPPGTINALVMDRLEEMAETTREFIDGRDGEEDGEEGL